MNEELNNQDPTPEEGGENSQESEPQTPEADQDSDEGDSDRE